MARILRWVANITFAIGWDWAAEKAAQAYRRRTGRGVWEE